MSLSKVEKLRIEMGANVAESVGSSQPQAAPTLRVAGIPEPDRKRVRLDDNHKFIPTDWIGADPDQPRKDFADESIAALAESLKERGQLQAILVRKGAGPQSYRIVAGERRWRAATRAELPEMLCRVLAPGEDPAEVLADQLTENMLREDLAPVDQARALARLRDAYGWTQSRIAARIKLSQPQVSRSLALLDMPEAAIELVEAARLTPSTALLIAKANPGNDRAIVAAATVAAGEGSTRQEVRSAVAEAARFKVGEKVTIAPSWRGPNAESVAGKAGKVATTPDERGHCKVSLIVAGRPHSATVHVDQIARVELCTVHKTDPVSEGTSTETGLCTVHNPPQERPRAPRPRPFTWGCDTSQGAVVSIVLAPGRPKSEAIAALYEAIAKLRAEESEADVTHPIGTTIRVNKRADPCDGWDGEVTGYTPSGGCQVDLKSGAGLLEREYQANELIVIRPRPGKGGLRS